MCKIIKILFLCIFLPFSGVVYAQQSIRIGYYNLENLFDTKHDEGHRDWTYTPYTHPQKIPGCLKIKYFWYRKKCLKTDWTKKKLKQKINRLKKMLGDKNPDILAVSEVENLTVLGQLAKALGYQSFFLGGGHDTRGIHNGVMFKNKVKLVKLKSHYPESEYFDFFKTRDILQTDFSYLGKKISLFINHWPSQHKNTFARILMAKFLKKITKSIKGNVVAVGDFNTVKKEEKLLGRTGLFELKNNAKGTYYLKSKRRWEYLDRIFVSQGLREGKNGFCISKKGLEVKFIKTRGKLSRKASFLASDHLPLFVSLVKTGGKLRGRGAECAHP